MRKRDEEIATESGDGRSSLKAMISDAVSRSRGQGVVQGSTMFFKNLAESVSHSNRNLKIGLAFLTAAFVIVAASLGYLVFSAFRRQIQTETTMEARYQALDAKTRELVKPFLDRNNELAAKIAALETEHRREMDALRQSYDLQVDAARKEAAAAQAQVKDLQKAVNTWIEDANKQWSSVIQNHETRLKGLEGRK